MALSVFPELMDKIDPQDTDSSLRTIESYINYIVERVEFSLTNTFRTTTTLGSSAEAISLVLEDTVNKLSEASSQLAILDAAVKDLIHDIKDYEALDNKPQIASVELVGNKSLAQFGIASQEDHEALEDRVSDLEDAGGEANVIEIVKQNGTALPVTDKAVNVTVPTAVSELTNDSGYQNAQQVQAAVDTGLASLLTSETYGPAALVSFDGGQGGMPVKSCVVDVGAGVSSANVYMAGKNLLNFAGYTMNKREYGVTFQVITNEDGSLQEIIANGTDAATSGFSQIYISVPQSVAKHFAGKKLSGGHSDNLFIQMENASSPYTVFAKDTGNGATIAAGVASAARVNIIIRVARGATLNNAEVYPMIRDAEAGADYVPYQGKSWAYDPATGGLTPAVMTSLAGTNHIWSDQGDVTVEYGAFLAALQAEIERLQEGGT